MSERRSPLVLLVEDDPTLLETTSLVLERHGFEVVGLPDATDAMTVIEEREPDVALLDVMLPGVDGISLTRRIREEHPIPVVLLTARGDPLDVVSGLEAGADDYIVKPFDGPVLAARLRAVMRRHEVVRPAAEPEAAAASATVTIGDLEFDREALIVRVNGDEVALTPTELRLLGELIDHRGMALSRDQLLERVWGYTWSGDTRLVDVHIQRLRAKIGAGHIDTVRGHGYRIRRD